MKLTLHNGFLAVLAICCTTAISSCVKDLPSDNEPNQALSSNTSLFVATDRHEAGDGNNLAAAIQFATSRLDAVVPSLVLLGGDYVGRGPDHGTAGQPAFSLADLRNEIYRTLDPLSTRTLFTYGSHDRGCTDGYQAFFSGPHRADGYYVYGISYAQMTFATDSLAQSAIERYLAQGDSADITPTPPPDTAAADTTGSRPAPPPANGSRPYNGIDAADPFGISAESAAARFEAWVSSLNDHAPIVVMSHVPIHSRRGDNPGGLRWLDALNRAARQHDIILFFGHNHSLEERGDNADQYCYLLTPGDTLRVQGDSLQGSQLRTLGFTYANAGYLKLGWCTLVTFSDLDHDGHHDHVQLRRFNTTGIDNSQFGLTGKPNPYTLRLTR